MVVLIGGELLFFALATFTTAIVNNAYQDFQKTKYISDFRASELS